MAPTGEIPHEEHGCDEALARAFQFLGKRWNGVLLGTLMGGAAGFAELRRAIPGISDSVLSDRLSELSGAGLVQRTVREGPPVTVGYRLTAAGEALLPALEELMVWSRQHLTDERCQAATRKRGTARAAAE
ncbi:winged helix-turn-helix transcriptional regulator [Microlunatus parietis]|uniref:DNA-binding HxlR family transcriptional regulator n=1 Tax=Microlunatus parietis TaxID=682979 RepID=A0A7Y9IEQ3_9ACTN|nr:helix-turn-helix domain-containing protein [Microlunatus parietis]NYE74854.1 DNA-binding HxlR family transcriptional regulator [Microlunatus parietis]